MSAIDAARSSIYIEDQAVGSPKVVGHLKQALDTSEMPDEKRAGLHFDLGRAYEDLGEAALALDAYEKVLTADPSFPGVGERIASMHAGGSGPEAPSEADETLESFEDLVAEAEAEEDDPSPPELLETFDDVITEAEAEAEAEVEEAGKSEEPAVEDPGETGKPHKKKKISFV